MKTCRKLKPLFYSIFLHLSIFTLFGIEALIAQNHQAAVLDTIEVVDGFPLIRKGTREATQKVVKKKIQEEISDDESEKNEPEENQEESNSQKGEAGTDSLSTGRPMTEIERYRAKLERTILDHLVYPPLSRQLGETGQVEIGFTVNKDGTISDAHIQSPSAYPSLDKAALKTIQNVSKVDPLPEEMHREHWNLVWPIEFTLTEAN